MPVEIVTTLASAATMLIALAGGFGWLITRMDARFAAQDARLDARFDRVDARIDKLEARAGEVEHQLSEVKIAVARLEGPQKRLLSAP